jgi:hypothetical protein
MPRWVHCTFAATSLVVASQTPCHNRQDAMHIAEVETQGQAVSARRIDLNGATGGWEVLVRMAGKEHGWRVVIDRDNGKVRRKEPCPNPPARGGKKGAGASGFTSAGWT